MGKNIVGMAVAISLLFVSVGAVAATSYISDELSINMRRGPGTGYGITELLRAGTQVQTLDEANGWTEIRTPEGEVGYVLTRFLSSQPAARDRIQSIDSQLKKLKKDNEELRAELSQAMQGSEQLGKLKSELVTENEGVKAELERIKRVSANAREINEQNQQFRKKMLAMQSELERLRSENKALQSRREGMK